LTGFPAVLVAVLIAVTVPGSSPTTSAVLPSAVIAIAQGRCPTLTGGPARESPPITVTVSESQLATYTVAGWASLDAPLATGAPQAALPMPTAMTSSVTLTAAARRLRNGPPGGRSSVTHASTGIPAGQRISRPIQPLNLS